MFVQLLSSVQRLSRVRTFFVLFFYKKNVKIKSQLKRICFRISEERLKYFAWFFFRPRRTKVLHVLFDEQIGWGKNYGRQSQMLRKSQKGMTFSPCRPSNGTKTIRTVQVNRTISFRCCAQSNLFFDGNSFSSCSNCSKNDTRIFFLPKKKKFSRKNFFRFHNVESIKKAKQNAKSELWVNAINFMQNSHTHFTK